MPPSSDAGASADCERILLVDAEPFAASIASGLRRRGWTVDLAAGRQAALQRIDAGSTPAIVVVAQRLPDGSGLDLLADLRKRLPTVRLFVLTAHGAIASAVRAVRLGAENYLCKPISAEMLEAIFEGSDPPSRSADTGYPTLERAKWEYIQFMMTTQRTLARAAQAMGIDRRSLRRMLQKGPPAR